MSLPDLENFLFIPTSADCSQGEIYELSASSHYSENSFVLIPYQNPQVKKPTPKFFSIQKKSTIAPVFGLQDAPVEKHILRAGTSKKNYIENVTRLKEHIQRGNIYEINYCIQFSTENFNIDPFNVFRQLHTLAKAPYAMLFKHGDNFIISASPELFLKKEGSDISTKPIKGTIRRGKTPEEDALLKTSLQNNLKERTENVMAVDVARNDLSRFAEKGTVKVNQLYTIETFETVHQMVSTVSCKIKENTSFEKIIEDTFPMASMTGAPKLRAMDLIDRSEDFERGSYSGAMGIINEKGDYTLSVIIRSIFYNQKTKKISVAAGGAITYLSDPEKEYEECLLKAGAMLKILNATLL